jgi:hypothetical protein
MLFANLGPIEVKNLLNVDYIFILCYIFSMVNAKFINSCGFGFPVKGQWQRKFLLAISILLDNQTMKILSFPSRTF